MVSAASLKAIRATHNYIGVFFAPTILFFAITGGLQMFGLHESSRGSSYVPPSILMHLAQLHKKGTLYLPVRKSASPATPQDNAKHDISKLAAQNTIAAGPNPLAMKVFFAATAFALVVSTCTGLVMAFRYARRKAIVTGVLFAGIAVPLLLLL